MALYDPSLPQYYFSITLCVLNLFNTNPKIYRRVAARPALVCPLAGRLLDPGFVEGIRMAYLTIAIMSRTFWTPYEDDFGYVL